MINTDNRTAHPASFWGAEAAKVAANADWARRLDPRHDADDYAAALAAAREAI